MSVTVEQLSCQELVELVTDYLEGALPPDEHRRFEEHVGPCVGCRAYLDQMHTMIRLLGHLPPDGLDPRAERLLLDAFREWRTGADTP